MSSDQTSGVPWTSRSDAVAKRIEERISEQNLPAGHHLGTKESLRQEFNVAVATVNEAVRLLSSRGTIEVRPGIGGGLFVASPTLVVRLGRKMLELSGESVSVADSLDIRDGLEPLVIRDATKHRTEADIADLRKILEQMSAAGDAAQYLKTNWQLHRRMAEISPNLILRNLYLGLLDFVSSRVSAVTTETALNGDGVMVHRDLVDAIESGSRKRAETMAARHARLTASRR
ncbi:FadR/GntR family transcriptional regulator [Streptosporangium lutulentum]|uniref:DNA-binding FadR family transcriptional regulator n=1 Tax=Streptosporangium lutulentum TaxID=1461250 RepID=A0ABT9QJT2_9ACTN|nr:FCD domain-containing protein [Streptosporangium lutulentum]MDP9847021.1 DNA-binding FadR family transcriptional regulator [Streptosporangium lutulentum]